jgi:hypothetical protein
MDRLEQDDECAICLTVDTDKKVSLKDYFGCKCRQTVHEECLSKWNQSVSYHQMDKCIVCRNQRQHCSISLFGRAVIATYAPEIEVLRRRELSERAIDLNICKFSCRCLTCCCFISFLIVIFLLVVALIVEV